MVIFGHFLTKNPTPTLINGQKPLVSRKNRFKMGQKHPFLTPISIEMHLKTVIFDPQNHPGGGGTPPRPPPDHPGGVPGVPRGSPGGTPAGFGVPGVPRTPRRVQNMFFGPSGGGPAPSEPQNHFLEVRSVPSGWSDRLFDPRWPFSMHFSMRALKNSSWWHFFSSKNNFFTNFDRFFHRIG